MLNITNADIINGWTNMPTEGLEGFGDEGDLVRKHLLNPALFELLGDVSGRTILDAGCGQGYLSRMLARRGATVIGIEPAEAFFRYAIQREQTEQLGIHYVQVDLSTWKPEPTTFDTVVANMVLMDIADVIPAMRNCIAALKPNGHFIFSILHPCFEEGGSKWRGKGFVEVRDYFKHQAIQQKYGYYIHRTLSDYLNAVVLLGCSFQRMIEPQLDAAIATQIGAERYASVPGHLVIAAMKPML